jgi:heptosyltransferase-2
MVMAQSLFKVLKENYPNSQIDVLAPEWTFSLLERMPEVTEAVPMPLGHGSFGWAERKKIGLSLRNSGYEQSIVLPNSWKSALIPWFANIPKRTGYIGELRWGLLNDTRKLDKMVLTMTVQRFVSLGHDANAPQPPEYPVPTLVILSETVPALRVKFGLTDEKQPILGLCPGAEYGPAKCWPAEHYAAIANQKLAEGWAVAIFGSTKDQNTSAAINQLTEDRCLDLSGKTTMGEAIDLMSLTTVVVSNDSGLMHVAAALDKKLVALYGSSDPSFTPPLNKQSRIIDLNLDCSPCFKRECPYGHYDCLQGITPEQVAQQIEALMG